jgi:hypothetical protein
VTGFEFLRRLQLAEAASAVRSAPAIDEKGRVKGLLTDILDTQRLPDKQAQRLYAMRWGVEAIYRSSKQTLQRRRLLSRTPQTCLAEAARGLVGIGLLGLMTVRQQMLHGLEPRNWSVANARDAVRYAMRNTGRPTKPASFLAALVSATNDDYVRQGSKRARNYPRQKREKPPGPPNIKPATAKEQQRAKRVQSKTTAVM